MSLGGFYEPERREVSKALITKQDRLTDFVERDHNIVLEYNRNTQRSVSFVCLNLWWLQKTLSSH
ncbi:hypothetical protein OK016_00440 [Vibrio chagasii]|nr:hypothetical protein [Vibrio chagasii]